MLKNRYVWILIAFIVLVALLAVGLDRAPHVREIPSPLIGKPAPEFSLPVLEVGNPAGSPQPASALPPSAELPSAESPSAGQSPSAGPGPGERFGPKEMAGKVWLLNVWATWCVGCRDEHALLVELSQKNLVPIVGLNYKEVRGDAAMDVVSMPFAQEAALVRTRANHWLVTHGNPYARTVLDIDGRVAIDYGVYGVPETFLIDKAGVVRWKQVGPVTPEILNGTLLPKIEELNQ